MKVPSSPRLRRTSRGKWLTVVGFFVHHLPATAIPFLFILVFVILWFQPGTEPPERRPTSQPQTTQRRTRPATDDYSHILRLVFNRTGAYRAKSIDQAALGTLPPEEEFNALVAAIQGECRGRMQSQHQFQLAHALCSELRRRFPLRGKPRLMELYRTSKGEEIRRVIVFVLRYHNDHDTVPEIIDGLKGETNRVVLESVDYSLGEMTGHPSLGRQGGNGSADWRLLTAHWRAAVASGTRPGEQK